MNDVVKRFGNCICIFVVIFWLSLCICAVLLPLHVEAAELETYSFNIIATEDYYKNGNYHHGKSTDLTVSSSKPVTYIAGSSSDDDYVTYYIIPRDFDDYASIIATRNNINGIEGTIDIGSRTVNGVKIPVYFQGNVVKQGRTVGDYTTVAEHNLSYFNLSDGETLDDYLYDYYMGNINLPQDKVDIENPDFFDEAYYLKGFKADANINASWTGTSERTNLKDVEVYEYVRCFAGYSYKTSPGQIATRTEIDNEFPITNKSLSLPWADMQHENEDLFLRYIQFAPIYSHSEGIFGAYFYGKSCYIYFNLDGTVEKGVDDNMDLSSSGVFNPNIEIPKIYVDASSYSGGVWLGSSGQPDSLRKFQLSNAAENYFIEMRGRWYSVDDVQLYKENLMWKYKYDSIIKNDLTTWVSVSDAVKATGVHNFADLGRTSFENLLTKYPVDSRNFTGGKNLVGNIISGYNDALSTLKLLLNACESVYNGVEVYVRYYYYDDSGKIVYSKWTHYFDNLANPAGSSGSTVDDKDNIFTDNQSDNGLTDDDVSDLEESDNSRIDPDVVPEYIFETDDITIATQNFFTIIADLIKSMGQVPELVSSVFSFLPNWCITLIGLGLGAIVILRFIGR